MASQGFRGVGTAGESSFLRRRACLRVQGAGQFGEKLCLIAALCGAGRWATPSTS